MIRTIEFNAQNDFILQRTFYIVFQLKSFRCKRIRIELILKRTNFCEKSFKLFSKFSQELIVAKKLTLNKS